MPNSNSISIDFKNVSFNYNSKVNIFNHLDLSLSNGQNESKTIAIMGGSGIGKTTLLKLILGIEKSTKGDIIISKNAILAYVPQNPVLFNHLSIYKNGSYLQNINYYKNRFEQAVFDKLVLELSLSEFIDSKGNIDNLSGGQKQRVSLLRALSVKPDILMLDEPCNGLDVDVKFSFLHTLKEICLKHNILVLYISHHVDEAQMIADDVLYLYKADDETKAHFSQISEFNNRPPTLNAFNQLNFPKCNIIPVNFKNDIIRIGKDPNAYVTYENLDIVNDNKSERTFKAEFLYHSFSNSYFRSEHNFLFSLPLTQRLSVGDHLNFSLAKVKNVYDNRGILIL